MADRSDDPKRTGPPRERPRARESVEDWLAQRLAALGGDDDLDGSDEPGATEADGLDELDEFDEDAPTIKARVANPVPRTSRLSPPPRTPPPKSVRAKPAAPPAKTIPPSRPGSTVGGSRPAEPASAAPFAGEADDLPELEAEPLATEDVEPLLTEEAEPIEAPADTDERAKPGQPARSLAPDEAMWDLLGETTGSSSVASVVVPSPAASARPDAPTEEAPRPSSRASQTPTIPPASIKVTPAKVATTEPPVRRAPAQGEPAEEVESDDDHPSIDMLIAEVQHSPRPRRRRSAFSRVVEGEPPQRTPTPAPTARGPSSPEDTVGLVAGDTLTPEETDSGGATEAPEPPSVTASGFDEVFPISRGIPPVRARVARATPPLSDALPGDGANEKTSSLLATETGSDPELAEPTTVDRREDSEPGTQWTGREADDLGEKTQIRPPALAETVLRPQDRARKPTPASAGADDPTRAPFPAVAADADHPENAPTTVSRAAGTPPIERRFYAPHLDEEDELAGTIPPEVSSAVITWGSVIIGVLMFFVMMVIFAMFIVSYQAVT